MLFEFLEQEFYKLVTTITRDDDSKIIYNVPVRQCNQQTSVEESNYEEKHNIALILLVEYISNMETSKISESKTIRLYIVPGAPTLFYQQGNHNSCILLSLASALHYMGDEYASEYIIRRKQNLIWRVRIKVGCNSVVMFLWYITRENMKKNSIIVLRNGIHQRHMIYFGISLLIQLCVCY